MARDQDVDPTERLDGVVKPASQIGAVGKVGPHGDSRGPQLRRRGLDALRTAEKRDRCAGLRERGGHAAPEPAATTRDEGAASGQVEAVGCHVAGPRTPSSVSKRAVSR